MKVDLNYKNKIKRFLRDEYGVNITESNFKNGTNHPYVEFPYQGKPIRITLQSSTRETNLSMMKIQDIRRTLGTPLYAFRNDTKSKRSLEMMTKEVELEARATGQFPETPLPSPQIQAIGKMSFIALFSKKGYMLTICMPKEAREALGNSPLSITRGKSNIWEIKAVKKGNLHVSKRGDISTTDCNVFPEDKELFGRSLVNMLVSPGYVIVELGIKDRRPLNVNKSLSSRRKNRTTGKTVNESFTTNSEAEAEATVQGAIAPPTSSPQILTLSEMRALAAEVVRMARELEERTPYRLVSVRLPDGRKVWRAIADVIE